MAASTKTSGLSIPRIAMLLFSEDVQYTISELSASVGWLAFCVEPGDVHAYSDMRPKCVPILARVETIGYMIWRGKKKKERQTFQCC